VPKLESEKSNAVLAAVDNVVLESEEDPKVEEWEQVLIKDFASRVSIVLTELEKFEMKGKSISNQNPFNSDFRKWFKQIFSSFIAIPSRLAIGIRLGSASIDHFQKIWAIALERIGETIEQEHVKLGIKEWGLSLGVGFPIGVSGTISVTFKNEI